jgi:hypothetical protein
VLTEQWGEDYFVAPVNEFQESHCLPRSVTSTAKIAVVMKSSHDLSFHLSKVDFRRILTCNNQDVKASSQSILIKSEELSQPSFYSISAYGSFVNTSADGQSNSVTWVARVTEDQDKILGVDLTSCILDIEYLRSFFDPVMGAKGKRCGCHGAPW